jgi:hypothetical protein
MRRTGVLLGVVALVAMLVAGCTQVSAGDPQPVQSSTGGTSRPKEIDLTGKEKRPVCAGAGVRPARIRHRKDGCVGAEQAVQRT